MRDYIHFYIYYIHYIHSVDSRPQIQQSTFAGDTPSHLWRRRSIAPSSAHVDVSSLSLAFSCSSFSFLLLSIFLVTLALFKISFDVWQKHGLSLVYNFRFKLLCIVSAIRSCDNVISICGSIPRDLQVARMILHSSLFGQSNTKCSTVSVATPHSLIFQNPQPLYYINSRLNGIYQNAI